ncbi:hypothetical protein E8E11_004336 [Didymella keratinophila]|nr:hypothetical protein E8E11_004336 [Didymella keratinophila]
MQTALAAANATTAPSGASNIALEGSLRTASLAHYISKLAGESDRTQLDEPVFRSSPGSLVPKLRNDPNENGNRNLPSRTICLRHFPIWIIPQLTHPFQDKDNRGLIFPLKAVYFKLFQERPAGALTTSGNLTEILQRRHVSHPAAIWLAKKPSAWLPKPNYVVFIPANRTYGQEATRTNTKTEASREVQAPVQPPMSKSVSNLLGKATRRRYLIFIPGGRKYERKPLQEIFGDNWFPEIEEGGTKTLKLPSATEVRKRFFASKNKAAFKNDLDSLVLNPELLFIYIGMDERWVAKDDWKSQRSSRTKIKDNLELRLKINRVLRQKRASF